LTFTRRGKGAFSIDHAAGKNVGGTGAIGQEKARGKSLEKSNRNPERFLKVL